MHHRFGGLVGWPLGVVEGALVRLGWVLLGFGCGWTLLLVVKGLWVVKLVAWMVSFLFSWEM